MARRLHGHSFRVMLSSLMFILLNREQMCWHFAKALLSALYRENNAVFSVNNSCKYSSCFFSKKSNLSCRKMQYHMRRSPVTCIVINPRRHQPASRHVCTTGGVLVVDEHILKHCNQLLVMFPMSKVFISCSLMLFWRRSEQSLTFFFIMKTHVRSCGLCTLEE